MNVLCTRFIACGAQLKYKQELATVFLKTWQLHGTGRILEVDLLLHIV